MKNINIYIFITIFFSIGSIFSGFGPAAGDSGEAPVLTAEEMQEKTTAAGMVLNGIKANIAFLKEANDELIRQKGGPVATLLEDIQKKEDEIKKLKDANNITSVEQGIQGLKQQIDNAAVNNFAKAVDPASHDINYYRKINSYLKEIYTDSFVAERMRRIMDAQGEISRYLLQDKKCGGILCLKAIQDLGSKISKYTIEDQKAMSQLTSQLLPMQAQLISAQMQKKAFDELNPKQKELTDLQNKLNFAIGQMSETESTPIRRNKNEINQLSKIFDFIRSPNDAATATENAIMSFEQQTSR